MNETSSTSASGLSLLPDGIGTLTAIHFAIIAVLAVLVIIGLLWGIKAKRSRTKASHEVIAHAEEAGVAPEPVAADPVADERKIEQSQRQTQTVAPAPAPSPVPAARAPEPPQETPSTPSAPAPSPVAASAPSPIQPVADAPGDDVATPERLADEPIAAASPLEASPATEVAAPAPIAPAVPAQSYADDPVTQLKGLGPKVAAQLDALGVSTVGQMATLSESEAQRIDAQLGNFTGRMGRDRWIEQARLLAAGDKAGFEAVFGKL
ncbi:hypothetical protein [Sphingomonas sp. OK281]|uniref:hypothetical protein n=1 Tax=Sphingomonas sp. OK281 TaxID=1881067 RepID=UPI000B8A294B|nr:hypothetical protein [Sphingomonas sp. OK281]